MHHDQTSANRQLNLAKLYIVPLNFMRPAPNFEFWDVTRECNQVP